MFSLFFQQKTKIIVCDFLAVVLYMPFIALARILNSFGLHKIASHVPLNDYANKSFFIIRNDALDRFGTRLEQRFSKVEIVELMKRAGLANITVSDHVPFYHAVGEKV